MEKYYIDGDECSLIEKAEHKRKQLSEALSMISDIEDRIAWASDFSAYSSITDILHDPWDAISRAQEHLEDELSEIEERIEQYELEKEVLEIKLYSESELKYCLK
jgi:hypothetical protein